MNSEQLNDDGKRYYWMKLAGVSLGTFCLNSGYCIFLFVTTSLHTDEGLGSMTLAVNYFAQVVTMLFLLPFLAEIISCKWTLVLSGLAISIFNAANITSSPEILTCGAVFGGVGLSTMFATMNVVASDLAVGYAKLMQSSEDIALKKFLSILHTCYSMGIVCGTLVSAMVLSSEATFVSHSHNVSLQHQCGSQYCDGEEQFIEGFNSTFQSTHTPTELQLDINYLVAASLIFDGLGIILFLALPNTKKPRVPKDTERALQRILSTFQLLHDSNLLLLILFTINTGLMYSFISGDFIEGFVACSLGITDTGVIATGFSLSMWLGTFVMGIVSLFVPRVILFLASVTINITDLLLMLFCTPDLYSPSVFYIMTVAWGSTFSVWVPQLCALYGLVFPHHQQEAFTNHRIWYSLGFAIGFGWSHSICMSSKIYIMIGLLTAGTLGYLIVERRLSKGEAADSELTPLRSISR